MLSVTDDVMCPLLTLGVFITVPLILFRLLESRSWHSKQVAHLIFCPPVMLDMVRPLLVLATSDCAAGMGPVLGTDW